MFDFAKARDHMVESQIRTSDVTEPAILKAFRTTSRERFMPKSQMALAYGDAHVAIDQDRVMLRPRDFAKLVDAADIRPSDIVLDIACGRGYSTAIMARLADTVVGLETSDEAVDKATDLLVKEGINNAAVVKGDLKVGASEHGPFNVIFVNGAVSEVPKTWLSQLANKGRLVCIIQNGPIGQATVYTKSGNAVGERVVFDSSAPILAGFTPEPSFVF
ncbi:protein-L-isoaspartate(D-aspartate) O-methyltransferase [Litorimonas taeanensis]|uniref:Protein-L-isoaspartate O-methyltransferase n=1 Tax=Litorimonas taeanensis TaxID=568099 RepID=A0A420WLG4_9PROT|nr:protein-L-isoaspartate O-methyltransferase [Litorimonas taeanensis]RKQ71746.1 protein-L-isoaspartate(D-aspartate) O-methyltransferase [Litorimonas taeanensis]